MQPQITRLHLTLIMIILGGLSLQSQTFKWAFSAGDIFDNETVGMTSDTKGNVYFTGNFCSGINLNSGISGSSLRGSGSSSVFVGKFDSEGKHVWSAALANNSVTRIFDIGIDKDDNIYLAGTFIGDLNFKLKSSINTSIRSTGVGSDGFIAKYDSDGLLIWVRQIESKSRLLMKAMSVDIDGKIHIAGEYNDTTDFDPSAAKAMLTCSSPFRADIFVAQYTADGKYVWAKQIGGSIGAVKNINDIVSDSDGTMYITGAFEETVDFDPSATVQNLTASGQSDIFLASYNKVGKYLWAKKIGGINDETGKALALDNNKKLYLAGDFECQIDLDLNLNNNPLLLSAGGADIFLAQYDAVTGGLIWGKQAGGPGNEICGSLASDGKQQIYFSGTYENDAVFDGKNKMLSSGESDIFIASFSTAGTFRNIVSTGGKGPDQNRCLHLDNNNHLLAGGAFSDTVDFNPSPNISLLKTLEDQDMFIAVYNLDCNPPAPPKPEFDKISLCFNSSGSIRAEGKGIITWHSAAEGGQLIGKDKTYKTPQLSETISVFAQDSTCEASARTEVIIEVDKAIDTGITISGNTITARQANADYFWLDCNNNRKPIPGANSRSFTPVVNGNYAVIISVNSCSVLSACVNISSLNMETIEPDNVLVYPNPVSNILNIEYPGIYTARIYSIDGRLLYEIHAEGSANIDMSAYPAGMYTLHIDNGTGIKTRKIITE